MKRKRLLAAITIALIIIVLLVTGLIVFFRLPEESNTKVMPAAPSYITNTKIFLLSSNSGYGYLGGNPWSPCFIIHVTIRNDYTTQQPVDNFYNGSQGLVWFILSPQLFDKNGNQIQSQWYIPPNGHPNWNQQDILSNETKTLTINMMTSNRNVDHYTLGFGWIGSAPAP